VDVLEIPVSRITDQYLAVLRAMEAFDVNVAAEFLVMAATLMDIKSRSLLPETEEEEQEPDPRDQLVQQLLQYKRFKQAAEKLGAMARARALRFARCPAEPEPAAERIDPERLLEDVSVWDMVSAYAEVLRQTRVAQPMHIVHDDVPIAQYMEEVMQRVRSARGPVQFLDFFTTDRSRARFIGVFLALLELVARRRIVIEQPEGNRTHITIAAAPAQEG